MIKHVVCFKLKDFSRANEAKRTLLSMNGNVPMLRGIEVAVDELRSPRSFDVMLSVILDDFSSLDEYQKDAYHVGVVKKLMHEIAESSIAVDFAI